MVRNNNQEPEVSVVIPCLNEADTLENCLSKAKNAMDRAGINGEIIVADNGSVDGSIAIAARAGARVVNVSERGYGNALMGGIAASKGRFIVMGDADDSYDFGEVPQLVARLRDGADIVQGCRLPAGGGRIAPGAMPALHRWIGNPFFSLLARSWFRAPIHDVYCGMRGFTRALYEKLNLRCTGMEFATEMIIKSSLMGAKMAELPITLHKDGRISHPPHLHTFRDGWRTLRFFLMFTPRWLFLAPGLALIAIGVIGYLLALPGVALWGAVLDAHTLVFAGLAILSGYQALLFAIWTEIFGIREGLMPIQRTWSRFFGIVNLERGLMAGAAAIVIGAVLLIMAIQRWWAAGFGDLDYAQTMRLVLPGAFLTALGVQTVFASFFASILGLDRK